MAGMALGVLAVFVIQTAVRDQGRPSRLAAVTVAERPEPEPAHRVCASCRRNRLSRLNPGPDCHACMTDRRPAIAAIPLDRSDESYRERLENNRLDIMAMLPATAVGLAVMLGKTEDNMRRVLNTMISLGMVRRERISGVPGVRYVYRSAGERAE